LVFTATWQDALKPDICIKDKELPKIRNRTSEALETIGKKKLIKIYMQI